MHNSLSTLVGLAVLVWILVLAYIYGPAVLSARKQRRNDDLIFQTVLEAQDDFS